MLLNIFDEWLVYTLSIHNTISQYALTRAFTTYLVDMCVSFFTHLQLEQR